MKMDRARAQLIIISALPLIIGSFLAYGVLGSTYLGAIITESRNLTLPEIILQAITSTILSIFVVFTFYYGVARRGRGAQKIAVAFLVSPILFLVSLFISQSLFLILLVGSSDAVQGMVMVISLAVTMLSVVLIMIDAIPPLLKNIFVAFYGSTFGTFLGITFVTGSMFVIIISLIVEDFFLTRFHPVIEQERMLDKIGQDPFDYTRIQSDSVAVGVGDFVAFSLIASHTIIYFPVYVWILTGIMMFLGMFINVTILAKEGEILPAIPLPALLAIIPWFLHIISFVALGG